MKEIWNWIQIAFTALGGFIGWFLGGMDGFLYALIAFAVIDYITGVLCAISDKTLSSEVGFKGICRKVLIFTMVGIGNILDIYVLGETGVLRTAVIFFYLSKSMRLKHKVRINIADKSGKKQEVLQSEHRSIPKRLLTFLFGEFCEVLVLTPGETVQGIEIKEMRGDGNE